MLEIKIALQEKQKLFRSSIDKFPITLFGGARGGGKSYAIRNIFLIRALEYPGSKSAIFRKTFPELDSNHIRPLLSEHPCLYQFWNESKKLLSLPNGSTIQFSYCENDKDVARQQGQEIHNLGVDEIGQWGENVFRTLLGSNRSSNPNIPARCALSANPGGAGNSWLKRLFIDKKLNERERPQDYNFIQSLIADNPALMESDPDYVHRLNSEPNENLRKAYLYGDWDLAAGQFFGEIQRDVHFINPFEIPKHWKRFGALDYGFTHPAGFGWFTADEDGNVYQYRELVEAKLRVDQLADKIKSFDDWDKLEYIVAGLDCWNDRGVSTKSGAPTIAEEFSNKGLYLSKANVGRIQGATQVRNYLAYNEEISPRFRMFKTCAVTYDCLTRMQHDPNRPEDVLKVDAVDGDPMTGDEGYDFVRYFLMSRPAFADRPMKRILPGTEAWNRREVEEMERAALNAHEAEKNVELGLSTPSDDPWSKNPTMFDNDW